MNSDQQLATLADTTADQVRRMRELRTPSEVVLTEETVAEPVRLFRARTSP